MKNILFVLVVLNGLFFSNLFVAAQSTGEISKAQAALLDTLPHDQRESILGKIRQADELQSELEQAFEDGISITKRLEKKILTAQELLSLPTFLQSLAPPRISQPLGICL